MTIVSREDFKASLPPNAKVLGLDIGTKTIGLAFGSVSSRIATPLLVIERSKIKADAAILAKAMAEYETVGLVVGWPLDAAGDPGPRCQAVRDVTLELLKYLPDVPVVFYDERFSTVQSHSFLIEEVDMSRKKRGKIVDKMAAQIILQNFLAEHKGSFHSEQGEPR